MSGLRHRDAPVMPLGPSVFVPHLRHLVGDLDLSPHSDQTHTHAHTVFVFPRLNNHVTKRLLCASIYIFMQVYLSIYLFIYIYVSRSIYIYIDLDVYIQIDR